MDNGDSILSTTKGQTKDEQTKKKNTDQDLLTIMLKEYNTTTKYNKMLAKTSTTIPKALMLDQFDPDELRKVMKKVAEEVEEKRRRIEVCPEKMTATRTTLLMKKQQRMNRTGISNDDNGII